MNVSFQATIAQMRQGKKCVTRRTGVSWRDIEVGTIFQPVEKGQGLKKGETVKKLGPLCIVKAVRVERLDYLLEHEQYGLDEMVNEGFPKMAPKEFIALFCKMNKCKPDAQVVRIMFEHAPKGSK